MRYDRATEIAMIRIIEPDSNCIDIGCHKGEILNIMLRLAPKGRHAGFEPIPDFYNYLIKKFKDKAEIYPYALSDKDGKAEFQYVKNAPAYSGLKKRDYQVSPKIDVINVDLKRLDDIMSDRPVRFIKIDVEGTEYDVLKGAMNMVKTNKPYIIFEFGFGASNYYNITPAKMYNLLCGEGGLKISTLKNFNCNKASLTLEDFEELYLKKTEYYFIAHP